MAQDSLKKRNQSATSQTNEEKDGKKHHYLFTIDEIKLETKNLKLDQRFFLLFGIIWFLFVIVILADLDYNRNKEIDQFKSKDTLLASAHFMDKVVMTIDNEYWCGGYKNWLVFSQNDQNCTLLTKSESEQGKPVQWSMRKSTNSEIIKNELGDCQIMGFDLEQPIYVSILSDHSDDFCPKFVETTFYSYVTKNFTVLSTKEITRYHDKYQNDHVYLLYKN